MSANIGSMVFFDKILEDGEIDPDSVDWRLQEDGGEFSDDAIHFTTKMIDNPKDHAISDNLANRTSDEGPTEAITEEGQNAVQAGVTAVENNISGKIYKDTLPCLEMELPSHTITE